MPPPAKHGHTFPATHPAVTPTNRPKLDTRTLLPRATRTPPLPDSTRSLGASLNPALGSYVLPPGSPACVQGRSCSEARSRQKPARRWPRPQRLPIPAGPTRKVGYRPGQLRGVKVPRAWCTHSRRPAPLGIRRKLPETPPWPRPVLQRRAWRDSRGRGVADSWWGEFGKFMLSADWPARNGAQGRRWPHLPHPTLEEEGHSHPALVFGVPGLPQTLSS